jgi:hypothetical protein
VWGGGGCGKGFCCADQAPNNHLKRLEEEEKKWRRLEGNWKKNKKKME